MTLKELLEADGQEAVCLEQNDKVGGVFSNAWEGATMTSSNLLTVFGCYPLHVYNSQDDTSIKEDKMEPACMWMCREYCRYLEAFVDHFGIRRHIQLGARVVYVRRNYDDASKWEVGIQKVMGGSTSDNDFTIQTFDAIAVCSGLHQRPNIPS